MTLKDLPIGKTATITSVGGEGRLRQHLLDMGLIPGVEVSMIKHAPMGDPIEIRVHSYELTLRLAEAQQIDIENIHDIEKNKTNITHKKHILRESILAQKYGSRHINFCLHYVSPVRLYVLHHIRHNVYNVLHNPFCSKNSIRKYQFPHHLYRRCRFDLG